MSCGMETRATSVHAARIVRGPKRNAVGVTMKQIEERR